MSDATRYSLVSAMARCCAKKGYLETSVEDVLAEAGVERSGFDLHFGGKEDCALSAVKAILGVGISAVGEGYSADKAERESTIVALLTLLRAFAASPPFAHLAVVSSRQMMPAGALVHYESGFTILTATLDRLRSEAGGKSILPPAATRAAIGGAEAVVRREIEAGRTESLPQLLPDLVYGATVPFLGQLEALRLARLSRSMLRKAPEA